MESLNLSYIMDSAVDIHKKYLKSIVLFQLIMALISTAIIIVCIILTAILFAAGSVSFASPPLSTTSMIGTIVIMAIVLGTIISTVISLGSVGMMDVVKRDYQGFKVEMSQMLSFAFKHFFRLLGANFALVLALIPLAALWFGLGWFIFKNIPMGYPISSIGLNISKSPIAVIILLCLFVLLVLFSITIYKTLYIFTINVVVFQNKSFFKALSESRRLVKNNFWRIMGYSLLFYLTVWVLYNAINSFFLIIATILMYFLKLFSMSNGLLEYVQVISSIMTWPMRILEQLFITPLSGLFISLLYYKQRYKKDGYDIVLNLEAMRKK